VPGNPTAEVCENGIDEDCNGTDLSCVTTLVTCVAKDTAGNVGSASITVTLDSTPPRVTIDSPKDGSVLTASPVTITGIVNDLVMVGQR
jgi:hypothetical protein